jgi:hypothetical protein
VVLVETATFPVKSPPAPPPPEPLLLLLKPPAPPPATIRYSTDDTIENLFVTVTPAPNLTPAPNDMGILFSFDRQIFMNRFQSKHH